MRLRTAPWLVAGALLAAGVAIFTWASGSLRGHGGDVLVVPFLVSVLAGLGVGTPRARLIAVGLAGLAIEGWQALGLVSPDAPAWVHATVGSRFDPLDLVMYAIGLLLAAGLERAWRREVPRPTEGGR